MAFTCLVVCLRHIQKAIQMFVEFWLELVESSAIGGKTRD